MVNCTVLLINLNLNLTANVGFQKKFCIYFHLKILDEHVYTFVSGSFVFKVNTVF